MGIIEKYGLKDEFIISGDGRVIASPETLMRQAGYTAEIYMEAAVEAVKKLFGEEYQEDHPELVIAFMKVASDDYISASNLRARQDELTQREIEFANRPDAP